MGLITAMKMRKDIQFEFQTKGSKQVSQGLKRLSSILRHTSFEFELMRIQKRIDLIDLDYIVDYAEAKVRLKNDRQLVHLYSNDIKIEVAANLYAKQRGAFTLEEFCKREMKRRLNLFQVKMPDNPLV